MDILNEVSVILIGKDELYTEFFKCNNCECIKIIKSYKFCPNCGLKIIRRYRR